MGFSLSKKNSLRHEMQHIVTLSYIRQGALSRTTHKEDKTKLYSNLHSKWTFRLGFIKLCGVWKCKFPNSKSSGWGPNLREWWLGEKISLNNNESQWIVDNRWQAKKQWQITIPPRWEAIGIWFSAMVFPPCRRNSAIKKNVRLKWMRFFGHFLFQQTDQKLN